MINILLVDDSPTMRHLIRCILTTDLELNVVGEAKNGEEALKMVRNLDPDIITMDIHMPKMDGYSAIRHIMAENPRPIIVLTSTESDIRLGITYKAVESGALMVFGKPHGLPEDDPEARALIEAIKAMADVKVVRRRWPVHNCFYKSSLPKAALLKSQSEEYTLVAIGTSTGGPPALKTILETLPVTFPVPIVVVQHITKGFTVGLAKWLNDTIALAVKVAQNKEPLKEGTVYIAPDDAHFEISRDGRVVLSDEPPLDGHRPSVTALFNSVAHHRGASAIGVLLTGMGRDGADGLDTMHRKGAYTIAQDEESSVVFGMPGEAVALGAARDILPLNHIGLKLRRLVEKG
ncbi:chemotaxis-specific protein-glutamate methyltransferase CheB [Desulfocicer niacini]